MEQSGYIKFTNTKQARWLKVRSPSNAASRNEVVKATIQELINNWKLYQPQLIISVTGGAKKFDIPDELMTSLISGLCKAVSITNAWIVSGGTDVGVMKLVGDVIALSQKSNESTNKDNLVVLGVVTWGVLGNRKGLLPNNAVFDYPDTLEPQYNTEKEVAVLLNPDHTNFIFVDEGRGNQFGQEIDFRTELESQLSKIKPKEAKIPLILLVINGGPNTLLTVENAMESNIPVLVFEQTKGCADLIAEIIKLADDPELFDDDDQDDESSLEKILKLINDSNVLDEFRNKDEQTREAKKNEAIQRVKSIIEKYQKNKSLINVFNVGDKENSEKNALDSQILKIFLNTQADHLKIFTLAREWNRPISEVLYTAISDNKPEFVEFLLERENVKLESIFDKKKLFELYDRTEFTRLLTLANVNWNQQYSDIKQLMKKLLPPHIKETIIPDDEEDLRNVPTNLFFWALLQNRVDLAKVFWMYTQHPLANALIASKVIKSIVYYSPELKKSYTDKSYLNDFEDLAIDLLKNFGRKTSRIRSNIEGLASLSLLENIEHYGNQCPLSIAYFCKCDKFYDEMIVRKTLTSIWLNGMTRGADTFVVKIIKDTANFLSVGLLAPVFNFNKNPDLQKKKLKPHEKVYIDDGKNNFRNKFLQIESEHLLSQYDSDETNDSYQSKYIKYWQAPKTKFINSFVSFCLFLFLFSYLIFGHMNNFCTTEIIDIYYRKLVFLEVLLDIWVFSYIVEEINQLFSYDLFMKAHLTFAWRINNNLNENNESCIKGLFRNFKNALCYYFNDPRNYLDTLAISLYVTIAILKYFLFGLFKKEIIVKVIKFLLYADIVVWYSILINYIISIFKISFSVERYDLSKPWDWFPYRFVLNHATYPILPLPLNLIFDPIYSIYNSIVYTKNENERRNRVSAKDAEITYTEEKCARDAYKSVKDKRLDEKIKNMKEAISEEDVRAPGNDKRLLDEINDRTKIVQDCIKEYARE